MMIHQRSKSAGVTRSPRPSWLLPLVLALGLSGLATQTLAQAPAAPSQTAPAQSAAELDKLVASIALYPDDLIGLILPASTFPLEIVQADRYLDKRKADPKAPVNEAWDDTVKSLLNYPEVVKKMSADLDWTSRLGEAVVADQGAVLEAIQRFRRQTQAAGNLKSDDKQVIVVEKEVIKIVPADPQVIYVPQYNPTTVVVYGGYSSWGYYPTPYPVYYYPYAPGAAFTVGLIWGAAISNAWNGGHYVTHYGGGGNQINIDRSNNINIGNGSGNGSGNRNNGNRGNSATQWKSDKKPGEVRSPSDRSANRVGDSQGGRGGDRAGAGNRASTQPSQGARGGDRAGDRGGQPSVSDRAGSGSRQGGGDAFGSYGSGRDARADSARGASSRQSSAGARSSAGGGRSGGARAGGGGRGGRR